MRHYIDLHIHSRFSRATSPSLNPENLSSWGGFKGLSLIGTGDLTHPTWLKELKEKLRLRDDGFYSLKDEPHGIRFVPTGEISAIYKQDGRTRKIHLVVIAPDLEAAEKFSKTLGALGNVESDGRPILGLSAKNILEIALNTSPGMVIVPAHIWTPWFSLFGAKSGFDQIEECFGDLSSHITALETGLSSDPAMNRLVSALDRYALISSSDAHSPDKLAREATIINGPLNWPSLADALKAGPSLGGTVEFFPEEGKYHLDGHLACGPSLSPEETKAFGGLCPVCGKDLTIGVLHRVMELADRSEPLNKRLPDMHLIPLAEILSQIFSVGPKSKKVAFHYEKIIREFGSELTVLLESPLNDIEDIAGPLFRLAIERMRKSEVSAEGGFDGKFGVVSVIGPQERAELSGQGSLFEILPKKQLKKNKEPLLAEGCLAKSSDKSMVNQQHSASQATDKKEFCEESLDATERLPLNLIRGDLLLDGLDESQVKAVSSQAKFLSIMAGPGSGKTKVLTHRAAWLLREGLLAPHELLLCSFTRKSAEELAPRLKAALSFRAGDNRDVAISTLHGLAFKMAKAQKADWDLASEDFLQDLYKKAAKKAGLKPARFASLASLIKNSPDSQEAQATLVTEIKENFKSAFNYYNSCLAVNHLWDFDDIIIEADGKNNNYKAILLDEFQDLTAAQFNLIKRLCPPYPEGVLPRQNILESLTPQLESEFIASSPLPQSGKHDSYLTVIGDPDQSIYGFRGASADIFKWLEIYPGLEKIDLKANYRSSKNIVQLGESLMAAVRPAKKRECIKNDNGQKIIRASLSTSRRESAYVISRLKAHLGVLKLGTGGTSRQDMDLMSNLGLSDIAIIFRLRSQAIDIAKALDEAGLAWQLCGEEPLTAVDQLDFTADKINLLTMHAAKGLEFRLVFIVGAEDGLSPYLAPGEEMSSDRLNEERRLFYVALSRAKDRLYISRAEKRRLYGQVLPGQASIFWQNLDSSLCLDIRPKIKTARAKVQAGLFD